MGVIIKNGSVGEKIKAARKKAGLTQEQVGEILGVGASNICKYENELIEVSAQKYMMLLDIKRFAKLYPPKPKEGD